MLIDRAVAEIDATIATVERLHLAYATTTDQHSDFAECSILRSLESLYAARAAMVTAQAIAR